jgi:hypothetical protein
MPDTSIVSDPSRERLADDLLYGAQEIADFLGVSLHVVYYLAKRDKLPIGKLGKNLIASRRRLKAAAQSLTA